MDLLSSLGQGLGYAGDTLDKFTGGRALRGLAAGHPRELMSILPFSDSAGLTDESEKQSGRDVTDTWGLTNKGADDWGSSAAGFGADMLLNPANIAGGIGAFKAAPTIAKGLGAAAKSMSGLDLLDHVAGGVRGIGRSLAGKGGASTAGAIDDAAHMANASPKSVDTTWGLNSRGYSGSAGGAFDSLRTPEERELLGLVNKSEGAPLGRDVAARGSHGGSSISGLRALREPMGMVKDLGGDTERVIGGLPNAIESNTLNSSRRLTDMFPEAKGMSVTPWANSEDIGIASGTGYSLGKNPLVERHETLHGMTQNAAVNGGEESLPLISRLAAKAYRGGLKADEGLNFQTGIGSALDELGAHTYSNRGTADKLKGFGYFAGSPEAHANYHSTFASHDPLAAAAYHAAPGAIIGGVTGGAAGAADGGSRDGVGGALEGGLMGAIVGAGLGGLASHTLYSPARFGNLSKLAEGAEPAGINSMMNERNPVDWARRAAQDSPEARTANPRRYSTDPAKADFYSKWRNVRQSDRMWNGGEHPDDLIDKITGNTNKSLGLKYDDTPGVGKLKATDLMSMTPEQLRNLSTRVRPRNFDPERLGLTRSDPEWVNNRTFYHGTATPGLTPETLDIGKTDPGNLHGRGIYTTEEAGDKALPITKGYAEARADEAAHAPLNQMVTRDKLLRGLGSGNLRKEDLTAAMRFFEMPEEAITRASSASDPMVLAARAESPVARIMDLINPRTGPKFGPYAKQLEQHKDLASRILDGLGGWPETPSPLIYQAQSDFGKILDLDQPNQKLAQSIYDMSPWHSRPSPGSYLGPDNPVAGIHEFGRRTIGDDEIRKLLQGEGYDAMTHAGGLLTGADPHQVVIGLDPSKYRKFEPLPDDLLRRVLGGQ